MSDDALVPGTGQDWEGAARMAAARLHAHGPASLDERDVEALRRHPDPPGFAGLPRHPDPPGFAGLPRIATAGVMADIIGGRTAVEEVTADLDRRMEEARAARRAEANHVDQLAAGQARRDDAIERVDVHADDRWRDAARQAIRDIARDQPEMTGDDLWRHVPKPAEPRASGAVFRWAAAHGLIAPTDRFVPTTQATSHASPSRVWRSLTYEGGRLL